MNKREIEILKIGFEAGKKAIEMHPEDDDYDTIRFEEAQERVKNLCIVDVSNSAYLCKNVNGEDAVIIAENIASVFDKLEDITPVPEYVEVRGKSITVYK